MYLPQVLSVQIFKNIGRINLLKTELYPRSVQDRLWLLPKPIVHVAFCARPVLMFISLTSIAQTPNCPNEISFHSSRSAKWPPNRGILAQEVASTNMFFLQASGMSPLPVVISDRVPHKLTVALTEGGRGEMASESQRRAGFRRKEWARVTDTAGCCARAGKNNTTREQSKIPPLPTPPHLPS